MGRDGQNNIDEFAAGTDPNNAADVFKVLTTTKTASTFTVTANGKAARSYELQRQSTLGGLWEPVISVGPLGANAPVTLTDPAPPATSAFYRLSVTGP